MSSMKLLLLAASPFALPSLQLLAQSDFRPAAVIARPDRPSGRGKQVSFPPVKKAALELGLQVWQPTGKKELYRLVEQLQPDVLVNVAYGMKLPPEILEYPPLGCLNLHPSLLPAYRGAAPIRRAIMVGEKETGVTVLFMAEELDAGDIILQETARIALGETYGSLQQRLARQGAELLLSALELLAQGKAPRHPQEEEKATYAPPLTPEDERVNWARPAEAIDHQIRGLEPFPGAYTWLHGKRLKLRKVIPAEKTAGQTGAVRDLTPGTICRVGRDSFSVLTGQDFLQVLEVQLAGKKRMHAGDFLRGYPLEVGEKLG